MLNFDPLVEFVVKEEPDDEDGRQDKKEQPVLFHGLVARQAAFRVVGTAERVSDGQAGFGIVTFHRPLHG